MPIIRWPKIKKTWETIERAIREEFSLKDYAGFPDRKLAAMDY